MFLPFRDSPNPAGRPYVTWLLIAVNVLVFVTVTLPLSGAPVDARDPALREALRAYPGLLEYVLRGGALSAYDLFVREWGYVPAYGGMPQLFASMFLHGGFMHLAGNMLFLWIYGDNVEARLGRLGFLGAYLGTGVLATMTHAAFDFESLSPTVGASGAISGVLGLYFVFFPKNQVHVLVLLIPIFVRAVLVPARLALGFYLVVDNLLPVFLSTGGSVAYGAHIGGFVGGVLVAYLIGARGSSRAPHAHVPEAPLAPTRESAESVEGLIARGRMEEAAQRYFVLDGRLPVTPRRALELAQWLAEAEHPTAALQVFERVIADTNSRARDVAWGHLGAGFVCARDLDDHGRARVHLEHALRLDARGEAGAAAAELLTRLGQGPA